MPDTITDGGVTVRSVTATSASVLCFPDEGRMVGWTDSPGALANRGSRNRRATRNAVVDAFLEAPRGSLHTLEIAAVPIACAPLLVEETIHDYETTGGNLQIALA